MTDKTTAAAQRVVNAWLIPGPRPDIHHNATNHLRRTWPHLAHALDQLAKTTQETQR